MEPLWAVEAQALGKSYGRHLLFENLNFTLAAGRSLALLGPSGCGKSTLLHILAGLVCDYQGQIRINSSGGRAYLMLQQFGLFPWKNALANLELPLLLNGTKPALRRKKAADMLNELGLEGFSRHYPGQLSGGQQQRLALGRALISSPEIILLDEPFSSLDALTRERLQNLLAGLKRERELTMVLATHSIEEAVFLGDRILVMGGTPGSILSEFDNPLRGLPNFRLTDDFYKLAKVVRHSLDKALTEEEVAGP